MLAGAFFSVHIAIHNFKVFFILPLLLGYFLSIYFGAVVDMAGAEKGDLVLEVTLWFKLGEVVIVEVVVVVEEVVVDEQVNNYMYLRTNRSTSKSSR